MDVTSRKGWGARKPRPRTRQAASSVREFFIHWPGAVPNSWRELVHHDELLRKLAGADPDAHPLDVLRHINTPAEERATMRAIQNFHMDTRGWSDFAYTYGVMPTARAYMGRGLAYVPAAQERHNTGTVACCVFLGPNDRVTPEIAAAIKWLRRHVEQHAHHRVDVRPHRAVTPTECPGPRLTELANRL